MAILYLGLVLLLFLFPCEFFVKKDNFNEEYLSKEGTLQIKGFFVILVLFRHMHDYVSLSSGILDKLFIEVDNSLGQLIVTMFLFYSGYGIYESYKKKGQAYVNKFMIRRIIPTWINFAICICLFILLNFILHRWYPIEEVLFSFIGWTSIGNSNWFMFVTFLLYVLFFSVFKMMERVSSFNKVVMFTISTIILGIFLYIFKESWWWNTIGCFTVGLWYSYLKDSIEHLIKNNYFKVFLLLVSLFVIVMILNNWFAEIYSLYSIIFTLLIVLITMKIKFNSPICSFLGKHVFSIYILQRMVFIGLSSFGLNNYKWLFVILSCTIVILLAVSYDYLFNKFRKLIKI